MKSNYWLCLATISVFSTGCSTDSQLYQEISPQYQPSELLPPDYELGDMQFSQQEHHEQRVAQVHRTRARDSDLIWVSEQPSGHYTIQLDRSGNASAVAKRLYQAPKVERRAEIATRSGYVGVLGSFETVASAEQLLATLPDDLRKDAKIVQWREVQE